jgi:hypothetical protein
LDDFEYGIVAFPATVRSVRLFPRPHKISKLFAACKLPLEAWFFVSQETLVYGTVPDEQTGKIISEHLGKKWKQVVVPVGTNPREFFAAGN